MGHIYVDVEAQLCLLGWNYIVIVVGFYCVNAVPGARTQTTLPLSPPQSNMAPPSENNGKVKKDITKLPWRCTHHIRVICTVNGMLLCLGYGCSSASPPPFKTIGSVISWFCHFP